MIRSRKAVAAAGAPAGRQLPGLGTRTPG